MTKPKRYKSYIGKSKPNPDHIEGYNTWKAAFYSGEAGVFTISVSEIVGFVEETIDKQ